jgi:RND family efflux transporter MFP subunit
LADADLLLSRLSGLWGDGKNSAIPRQTLDEAQARRDGMEAQLHQAMQALRYSRKRLDETIVRAPYAGRITARWVDPGESVVTNPVTVLLEIQETQNLELIFTLPQESRSLVNPGTPIEFRVAGLPDRVGRAVVESVDPAVDEATRAFTSRARVDNSNFEFMPGMLANVGVLGGRSENALAIPRRALSRRSDGWSVMVLRDGHPVLQPVGVGLIGMESAEILDGLSENDRVLVPRSGA